MTIHIDISKYLYSNLEKAILYGYGGNEMAQKFESNTSFSMNDLTKVQSVEASMIRLNEIEKSSFHAFVGQIVGLPSNALKPVSSPFIKELYIGTWKMDQYNSWLVIVQVNSNGTRECRCLDASTIETFKFELPREEQ